MSSEELRFSSKYWELACCYLEGIAMDAEHYRSLTPTQRAQFWP